MNIDLENILLSVDTPPQGDAGNLGTWTLETAREIAARVYNHVAHTTGHFDTYRQFRKRFYAPPPAPQKIDFDGLSAEQQTKINQLSTVKERTIALEIFKLQNHNAYETALQDYRQAAANTSWIRSTFDDGLGGYLVYAHTELSRLAQGGVAKLVEI